MKRVRALYRLQTVETEIIQKGRRLKEVDLLLGDNESVKAAQSVVEKAESRLHTAQTESRRLDLEIRGLEEEAAATEKRLYGGHVTNPKELASLQDKIKNLKERRGKLEDDLLEMMVEAEDAESGLTLSRESLSELQAEWESSQSDLTAERDTLARSLSTLQAERESLLNKISSDDLDIFQDLWRRKGGRGVVKMVEGICQGCGVTVPTSKARAVFETDDLIFCGNCERILCD